MIYFLYDEVRKLIFLSRSIQLYIYVIFSIHYSQIENKVESEKHFKDRFFTVRTNPTLRVSSNMGWGVCEQYWMYQIICGFYLNSRTIAPFIFARTNPTWTYFTEGNSTCVKDY